MVDLLLLSRARGLKIVLHLLMGTVEEITGHSCTYDSRAQITRKKKNNKALETSLERAASLRTSQVTEAEDKDT